MMPPEAGAGPAAGADHPAQHQLVGHPVKICKKRNLDGCEAFEVDLGANPLEAAQEVRVVAPRQIRVQAVDDVDLGQGLVRALQERYGLFKRGEANPEEVAEEQSEAEQVGFAW